MESNSPATELLARNPNKRYPSNNMNKYFADISILSNSSILTNKVQYTQDYVPSISRGDIPYRCDCPLLSRTDNIKYLGVMVDYNRT